MMASRRRKSRERIVPIVVLAVLVALIGAVVVFLSTRPTVDPDTFCPHGGNYARTAILIDATDSLSATQAKAIREEVEDLRRRLALYEWVGVFVLSEDNLVLPVPEIQKCNPGSEPNPIYENPDMVRRRFEEEFRKPLDDAIGRLVKTTRPSPTSPILEMIRAVALDRDYVSTQPRRLIVVSDMLQNVSEYSHYRDGSDFRTWRDTDYARGFLQVSLLGVEVEILYLRRVDKPSGPLQTRSHVKFWEDYFAAVGATVTILKPVR